MSASAPSYLLPSDPTQTSGDPLSIVDSNGTLCDDSTDVPVWDILSSVLANTNVESLHELRDVLETVIYSLHGQGDADVSFLIQWIKTHYSEDKFIHEIWSKIVQEAMKMPDLFPTHRIPILQPPPSPSSTIHLSQAHIACLLAHQFLCTLRRPTWMKPDDGGSPHFGIWYASEDGSHEGAKEAYLTSVLTFFERLDVASDTYREHRISYTLRSRISAPVWSESPTLLGDFIVHQLEVAEEDEPPALSGCEPGTSLLISANRFIGFGKTGTQEERQIGTSPSACPSVLFTPELGQADVLIVRGAEGLVWMRGHGRRARMVQVNADIDWKERVMIFMDALELDAFDSTEGLPDLLPGHLERELLKAFTGFSHRLRPTGIHPSIDIPASSPDRVEEVIAGPWGCGAFCGNKAIKCLVMWMAASEAGVRIRYVVKEGDEWGVSLRRLVKGLEVCTVKDVWGSLKALRKESRSIERIVEDILESLK